MWIYRRGCLELRKQFVEIGNIDPFRYIRIAGVCIHRVIHVARSLETF
jgi:hypothetical protein